jgi:hypothetical protein
MANGTSRTLLSAGERVLLLISLHAFVDQSAVLHCVLAEDATLTAALFLSPPLRMQAGDSAGGG